MPSRPRSHQLESESEAAFTRAIPSNWVFRQKQKDYGIDGEVELFDASGIATGIIFFVQLKATDIRDKKKSLRLWIPNDTGQYYSSLDVPVLMVRYLSDSDEVYVKWFHSLDLYYGARSKKGVTFRFDESDKWIEQSAQRIETSVRSYRNSRLPSPALPIEFSIRIVDPEIHGIPRYELSAQLTHNVSNIRHLVSLKLARPGDTSAPTEIVISNKSVAVRIADMPVSTVHTEKGLSTDRAKKFLSSDTLMLIGLGLDWIGQSALGAEILIAMHARSSLVSYMPMVPAIARCLMRARRTQEAIDIAQSLIKSKADINAACAYLLPFWIGMSNESYEKRVQIAGEILAIAGNLNRRGFKEQAGTLRYSCANAFQNLDQTRVAIGHYLAASKMSPAYEGRSYYQAELASCYFREGNFHKAVNHYQRALKLKDDIDTRFRCADALMMSGRYLDAKKMFSAALSQSSDPYIDEWVLKNHVLNCMLRTAVPNVQRRIVRSFKSTFDPRKLSDPEIVEECERALKKDALSSLAWFNLAGVSSRGGDQAQACEMFVAAAVTNPVDLEAWVNAAAAAFNSRKHPMLVLIVRAAYERHKEHFVVEMSSRVASKDREKVAELLSEIVSDQKRPDAAPIFRVHLPQGKTIVVGKDGFSEL